MKFIVIVLVCCAMIGQIESQATGNRPNFIQSFFAPIGQFFSIFRRQTRPGVQADASIQQTGGQVDATASIFTDPQLVQENLNSIQQIQAEPVLQTQFVTEVMTVFSTIPSLERVTSIETVVEMTTETVFETVKMTQFKTEHITMTHTTGVCSTATPSSSKASSSSSSKVVEKSAVTPSAVST